jgi:hypothetical protein
MHDLFLALGIASVPTTVVLLVMYFSVRARALKAEQIVHDLTVVPALRGHSRGRNTAPLDVTDAIEALAIEVERIAEGQRFTTRLLSESRRNSGLMAGDDSRGRSITPH